MPPRFRLSLSLQMLLAVLLGTLTGAAIESWKMGFFGSVILWGSEWLGDIFLAGAGAIAVPLIFSSIVLGAVGLEPMRGLGRLVWKTLGWIAISFLLPTLAGLAAASFLGLHPEKFAFREMGGASTPFWLGLTLLSLAVGFYRNQIEEGHARLLARFCQGLDEILTPLVQWAACLAPLGVFVLALSSVARQHMQFISSPNALAVFIVILSGWTVYGLLVLPFVLWRFARINPWRYLRAVAPALLLALASGSPEATLPLTFDRVRRAAGISNRVASVTLSLCAALQRDGLAIAWMTMLNFAALLKLAPITDTPWATALIREGISWIMLMGGAAISVWSHACGAAIIAHSEGERNLLSPPPPKDPLAFDDGPADGAL